MLPVCTVSARADRAGRSGLRECPINPRQFDVVLHRSPTLLSYSLNSEIRYPGKVSDMQVK